jgi:Spy/CpxP family protein refolding chaperone
MNRTTLSMFVSAALLTGMTAFAQDAPAGTPPNDGQGAPIYRQRPDSDKRMGRDSRMMDHGGMRPGMMMGPPGMWWKNPDLAQKIGLTADQQKRMDDIFQQSRLKLIDLKANVEKQELIMEPMLADNPPDTNKVLAQIDRVAQARAELEKENAKMLLGIRGVLSGDQWTKLQAQRKGYMRHDRGGPGGPGAAGAGGPMGQAGPAGAPGFPGE